MKRNGLLVLAIGGVAALAATGTALGATARDVVPAPPPTVSATVTGAVDRQRAGDVALARVGGGQVVEVERDLEHGRQVWHVKVVKDGVRHDVYVDIATGDVVKTSTRDDRGGRRGDDSGHGPDDTATDDHGYNDHAYDDKGGHRDDRRDDDKGGDRRGGRDDG